MAKNIQQSPNLRMAVESDKNLICHFSLGNPNYCTK